LTSDWDRLFDELYLRTYAHLEDRDRSAEEAAGAVGLAEVEPGAEVLDCPCGYGRHSTVLARGGYRVTGADRSAVLLEEARRRAGEGEWPRWVQADFRKLAFDDAGFDCVLNLFTAIGYRGEDGDRRMLAEFRRVLRPGAPLVLETLHRDRLASIFQPRRWEHLPDGGLLLEEGRFDPVEGLHHNTFTLVEKGGARTSVEWHLRVYTATEIVALLRGAGFEQVEVFGGFAREAVSAQTRLVALARSS
jgi:SAM-dependent methyltransferase